MSTRQTFFYAPPVHIYYEGLNCEAELSLGNRVFTMPPEAVPHLKKMFWERNFHDECQMAECAAGYISEDV